MSGLSNLITSLLFSKYFSSSQNISCPPRTYSQAPSELHGLSYCKDFSTTLLHIHLLSRNLSLARKELLNCFFFLMWSFPLPLSRIGQKYLLSFFHGTADLYGRANFSKHWAIYPLALRAAASLGHPSEDHQNKKKWVRTLYFKPLTCMTAYLPTVETKRWLGP